MFPKKNKEPERDTGYTEFVNEPIIFDGFLFPRFPSALYFADGLSGKRTMFIADRERGYQLSFEEGMRCMDQDTPSWMDGGSACIEAEYRENDRYLHQLRTDPDSRPGHSNFAFFHVKIPDESGKLHVLPGQMIADCGYGWSPTVEPILVELMSGMAVCRMKGGGTS